MPNRTLLRIGGCFSFPRVILLTLAFASLPASAQNRDLRGQRIILDDDNNNTIILQTGNGPITGGTLTLPDPGGAGTFLISNPSSGSQTMSADMVPGADDTYDLGIAGTRWQDIFISGDAVIGGEVRFVETGGGAEYVGFAAPTAVSTSQIWTLPDDDGTSGQVLGTDGSGVLSWTSPSSTVVTNSTLLGNGTSGNQLRINLGNANTWTANQTFAGTFLLTSNARIALLNSDNNARDIRFQEPSSSGTQYVGLRCPPVTLSNNYVFPNSIGSVGQVLSIATKSGTNDSATLTWATPTTGGTAGGDLTGSYPNPTVATGAVTTAKLGDSAVTGAKLATNTVRNAHIADGEVTIAKISSSGANEGSALVYDGSDVTWGSPRTTFTRVRVDNDDSPYAIPVDIEIVGVDVSSGPVTVSLPSAASVGEGKMIVVKCEAGNAATNGIAINRSGTDLINASSTSVSITFGTATGVFRFYSDGVSRWQQW